MASKFIRVNINHKGFIPILGCFGPVKNILLTEVQVNNLKRIIGSEKIELVNKPKKVISPKQADELRRVKQEPVKVNPEEIAEIIEVKPSEPAKVEEEPAKVEEPKVEEVKEEQPKPAPKRRGGRKSSSKKVEEEQPAEEVVKE